MSDRLMGGMGVAPVRVNNYAGTISTIVVQGQDPNPLILTCWHVLAYDSNAKKGDKIYQPPSRENVVALLYGFDRNKVVDVALAQVLHPENASPGIHLYDDGVIPFTKFADEQSIKSLIEAHGHVRKSGIRSHFTSGRITSGDVRAPVGYLDTGPEGWMLNGLIKIEPDTSKPFSEESDSGAPVINDNNEIVGILVGGEHPKGIYSYAIPINYIQNQFNLSPWNG